MTSLQKSSSPQVSKTIILSIKPRYADLILSGTKTVEFRRAWAAKSVDTIAIYASSPVQRIVGVVQVAEVITAKPMLLWDYCKKRGGGLSRSELFAYMRGKTHGFAVLLRGVRKFDHSIVPSRVIEGFSPPQSFRYMTATEVRKLERITLKQKCTR